jgi:integrase
MPKQKPDDSPEKKKRRRRTSVVVGHRLDGTPVKKYPSAPSKTKLSDKVEDLKRIHGAGGPGEMADVMFDEYAEKWLEGMTGQVAENTLITYGSNVRQHLLPVLGKKQVRSILPSDIKSALARLAKENFSISTRRAALARVKQIFGMAQDDHIRLDNPAQRINVKADIEPKRRALTAAEKTAAEKYIAEHQGTNAALMVAMHLYTCGRRGEIFGLQWKHVDWKHRKIKVCQQLIYKRGGGGQATPRLKTANSYRDMPLHQELYDIIHPLRGLADVFLFQIGGRHFRPDEVTDLWNAIVAECPALAELTPHYFRHNYATLMYLKGIPAKEAAQIMGETVKTMLDIYVHIEKELSVEKGSAVYDIFSEVAQK